MNDVDHSWRIVRAADRENLGICLDSFHILSRDWPTEGILRIPAEKLFFLQLADAPPMSLDVLSWSRHHRVFPGEGGFALARFLDTVLRAGYAGPLSLEIFNDSYRQTNVYRTAQEAHRSLVWLQDRVAALRAQRGEDERLPADAALTRLPQAQAPTGIQWAEVRGQRTDGLQALLAQLGFSPRGRHRTKPVRLWEQGAARVVLNEDHWAREEASLASLAVQVPSAQATARRCRELGFREVARLAHDDEQRFPAFLAPDETEVFLTEATEGQPAWVAEFDRPDVGAAPAAQPGADAALITGIDHVNLAQPRHHQAESMLFYRAALGLERRAATDVPGPDGLISSQVVRTEDGSVRLPLNVAPDLSAHPGREHVAFACRDILTLARRARKAGLGFLPVPENYYEDLAARFDLPTSRLGTLRELDLMYDRDERGEFLHFYTPHRRAGVLRGGPAPGRLRRLRRLRRTRRPGAPGRPGPPGRRSLRAPAKHLGNGEGPRPGPRRSSGVGTGAGPFTVPSPCGRGAHRARTVRHQEPYPGYSSSGIAWNSAATEPSVSPA